ncbi:ABC transporter ATP-binding protein [Lachnospiraceae bacterium MD1]|jgi:peptide/nickel transport system ATP-binding protein|uniref:ABC transporter ATP-binding protein n=1 Tax=Variimorphobacter saccharofermentans TaxID=2755051 RepID=A0A839K1T1_9FIRM|nr:ABC transporter ATP-binding protein [Variimorphobacter saccharofermentans]MBB2183368.1 ABC transporter ATP-binding protein [Variimorphobacter saccharofermentans]
MTPLLKVEELEVAFIGDRIEFKCIDKVSLAVNPGEILCIVGESGSGKSVTLLSVIGLLGKTGRITGGRITFDGEDLINKTEKEMDQIRGNSLSMIFQDAMTSLNPVFTIGSQLIETMRAHMNLDKKAAKERAISLLAKVGLPEPASIMSKYPHTLSGGMRQRVIIAMALACNPKLLIADEPTTALDVTIQAQIMQLLKQLKNELKMSIILITHDMGLVAEMADRVQVMYAGQIVEEAGVFDLFENPKHPYTQALLKSIPSIREENQELATIRGTVPEHYGEMTGCRFSNRCPYAVAECNSAQEMIEAGRNHWARCWRSRGMEEIRNE